MKKTKTKATGASLKNSSPSHDGESLKEILKRDGTRSQDGNYSLILPCIMKIDGFHISSISIIGEFEWLYARAEDGMYHYLDEEDAFVILKAFIRRGCTLQGSNTQNQRPCFRANGEGLHILPSGEGSCK